MCSLQLVVGNTTSLSINPKIVYEVRGITLLTLMENQSGLNVFFIETSADLTLASETKVKVSFTSFEYISLFGAKISLSMN